MKITLVVNGKEITIESIKEYYQLLSSLRISTKGNLITK